MNKSADNVGGSTPPDTDSPATSTTPNASTPSTAAPSGAVPGHGFRRKVMLVAGAPRSGPPGRTVHATAPAPPPALIGQLADGGRLEIRTEGYLALRGMAPPAPYLHHGALL